MRNIAAGVMAVVCVALALARCGPSGPPGSPVMGKMDMHCTQSDGGAIVQETAASSCHPGGGDGGVVMVDYGDTLFNVEGDDDDCKYHVKWAATPLYENYKATFDVTVTSRVDSSPVKGADIDLEVFLNTKHPAPNSAPKTTDHQDGSYTVTPILFDQPGRWTVRFHMFEDCEDTLDSSPHGHAAFYVDIP